MFSQIVDEVLAVSGRYDKYAEAPMFVDRVVKLMTAKVWSANDLEEAQVTTTAMPHIWPLPFNFRAIRSVYNATSSIMLTKVSVGQESLTTSNSYYSFGGSLVISGAAISSQLKIAYYKAYMPLSYVPAANRAGYGVYNWATGTWDDGPALPNQSHWVLAKYKQIVVDGAVASLLNFVVSERAPKVYAEFQNQLKSVFIPQEATHYTGV